MATNSEKVMDHLGPYKLNSIVTGDARELAKSIPDESVDLIFTDPVYDRIEDYEWLAETAARVLKPDRACLVWTSTALMAQTICAMTQYLNWAWCLYWKRNSDVKFYGGRSGITLITPCLWLQKGRAKRHANFADIAETTAGTVKINFKWGKPLVVISKWTTLLSTRGQVVFDPFTGGGTVPAVCKMLGRQYLAFEIDTETAELARQRVADTQLPLPLVYPDQLELGITNGY